MRLKNVVKNSFFNIISQCILILVGFFSQRVMNLKIGEELVGMNSVISNILALLSVSELGIAAAIVFHLYRALAEKNEKQIANLMKLYRKAYGIFAAFIFSVGLCILPFVHRFFNENSFSLMYVRVVYLLWLIRTVLSYLLSYKRSLLIADQKEYIVSILVLLANVINHSTIIILLQFTKNYPLVLLLNILVEVVINVWISRYVDKKYPYLKTFRKQPVERASFHQIMADIKNIFVTRLCAKLLVSTDSIIISGFVSVLKVGLYSNYCMITQALINIMLALTNALKPSVGNMFVEENQEKNYDVLRQITFVFFCLVSVCCVCLFSLITPFVTEFWLDAGYGLSMSVVFFCVFNFGLLTIGYPLELVMSTTGLFQKEKNLSIATAITNLVLSLLLVKPFGIVGVQIGTAAAYLVQMIYRTKIFFGEYLHLKAAQYVKELLQYVLLGFLETVTGYYIVKAFYQSGSFLSFILAGMVCVAVPCLSNLLLYCRSWRLKSVVAMVTELLGGGRSWKKQ